MTEDAEIGRIAFTKTSMFTARTMDTSINQGETLDELLASTESEKDEENTGVETVWYPGFIQRFEQHKECTEIPEHLVESDKSGYESERDIDKDDDGKDKNNSDHVNLEGRTDEEDKDIAKHTGDNKTCEPCAFDNETVPASAFCAECTEYLCKTCLRDHKRNKTTRSHQLLLDDDIPISKKPFEKLKNLSCCKRHPEREIEYRCADHDEYICSLCESRNHRKCENVEEIEALVDSGKDRDASGSLAQTLEKNIDLLHQNNKHKLNNIATLKKDLGVVNDTLMGMIKDVSELLAHIGEDSKREAKDLVYEQEKVLLTSIGKANVLIAEQEDDKKTIGVALKYGSPKQLHLVSQKMNKTISDIKARTVKFGGKDHSMLRLSLSKQDFSSLKLCSLTIADEGSERDIPGTSNDDFSFGSDAVADDISIISSASQEPENKRIRTVNTATAETQTTDDIIDKSLISCSLHFVDKHDIGQTMCQYVCNITGCVCFDDWIVLIDNNNSVLMRLGPNFTFESMTTLEEKPLGICAVDNCTVAVILEGKKVQRYSIDTLPVCFCLLNEFNIALHCRAISTAGNDVALLMSDEDYDTEIDESDKIEVQVRRVNSGHKVIVVNDFTNKSGNAVKMNDPRCLLYIDESHILIGEKNYVAEFDKNGRRERFFKSYKDHKIDDIKAITNDDQGNIYVCGAGSNNVHQIFSKDFFVNRIIVTDIENPCSLAFDARRKRLIVGCQDTDFVYEYQFKD